MFNLATKKKGAVRGFPAQLPYLLCQQEKRGAEESLNGDITVIVDSSQLNRELVCLACLMAKKAGCKVHLMHIIPVPRRLPLTTILLQEMEVADQLLLEASAIANEIGCQATTSMINARAIGPAIVAEAKACACSLIMLDLTRIKRCDYESERLNEIFHVLAHAPCRVWLLQD